MSFFEVNNLNTGYGGIQVIRDVSFSLEGGTVMGILGSNGSGKSTLLKAFCGILPYTGTCTLEGQSLKNLPPRQMARLCRYIPQRSGIGIDISLLDVVLMGFNSQLRLLEYPTEAMKQQARNALEAVGLGDRARDNYQTLSEGQKQMCILARTMVSDGRLLFLDEPESALDFSGRYRMLDHVRAWSTQQAHGAVVTLHDPQLALNRCDSLLLLKNGKICGMLYPEKDSEETLEEGLSEIYGPLQILRCRDRAGKPQLVLLKETEAWKR